MTRLYYSDSKIILEFYKIRRGKLFNLMKTYYTFIHLINEFKYIYIYIIYYNANIILLLVIILDIFLLYAGTLLK